MNSLGKDKASSSTRPPAPQIPLEFLSDDGVHEHLRNHFSEIITETLAGDLPRLLRRRAKCRASPIKADRRRALLNGC